MIEMRLYAKNVAILSLKGLITAVFAIDAFLVWIIIVCGQISALVLITEIFLFPFYL